MKLRELLDRQEGPEQWVIRDELANTMQEKVGVFRTGRELEEAKVTIDRLREQFKGVVVDDKGKTFNQSLIHVIETGFLLDLADTMVVGGRRPHREPRSALAHGLPERDDENWLKHTLAYLEDDATRLDYSEVTFTKFEPQVRTY